MLDILVCEILVVFSCYPLQPLVIHCWRFRAPLPLISLAGSITLCVAIYSNFWLVKSRCSTCFCWINHDKSWFTRCPCQSHHACSIHFPSFSMFSYIFPYISRTIPMFLWRLSRPKTIPWLPWLPWLNPWTPVQGPAAPIPWAMAIDVYD